MARKIDLEAKENQKKNALRWIFEFVFTTKTTLLQIISERNFNELVKEKLIASVSRDVLLSSGSRNETKIYLYRLTSAGLKYVRTHFSELESVEYRVNNYIVGQIVHDLSVQAHILRENLTLFTATSSIDKEVTHRRHKGRKDERWKKWRYDALAYDDERFIAIEVERRRKEGADKAAFLSKLRDFTDGKTGSKQHIAHIVCINESLAEFWQKAIKEPFQLHSWEKNFVSGKHELKAKLQTVKISEKAKIEIHVLGRSELVSTVLPKAKISGDTKAGKVKAPQAERFSRKIDKLRAMSDEQLESALKEIEAKAHDKAIESVFEELEAKIEAKYSLRLKNRDKQLRNAISERDRAFQTIAEREAEIRELQREITAINCENMQLEKEIENLKSHHAHNTRQLIDSYKEEIEELKKSRESYR